MSIRALLVMVIAVVLANAACASSTVPPREVPRATPTVSALRIALAPLRDTPADVSEAVNTALVRAGYNVIPIPPGYSLGPESADIVARVQVRRRPDEVLPGVVLTAGAPSYRYELTVQLMAPALVIDVITISFVAKDGGVEPDQVSDIPKKLGTSEPLLAFAKQVRDARTRVEDERAASIRHEQAKRAREAEEHESRLEARRLADQQRRHEADNLAWVDAGRDECERALTLDACKNVERYLATFPDGLHAHDAKQVLEGHSPSSSSCSRMKSIGGTRTRVRARAPRRWLRASASAPILVGVRGDCTPLTRAFFWRLRKWTRSNVCDDLAAGQRAIGAGLCRGLRADEECKCH